MVKTRKVGKRKATVDFPTDPSSQEELSPLAEAVRRVSPFVSITPTPPPSRHGPSPRKRILVEDRLEVRPVASTSKLVQHPVPSTSKATSSTSSTSLYSKKAEALLNNVYSDSEDEELALMEQRLMESEDFEEIIPPSSSSSSSSCSPPRGRRISSPDRRIGILPRTPSSDDPPDLPVGERVAYIHVSEGCEEDLEAQLKGAKNLDIQILEEESLPDIDESDMIHGLDHTGTSRDYVDERHRCTLQCAIGCQGHLRPNEIVIYESFKWKGRLRGRRRYAKIVSIINPETNMNL